MLQNTSRRRSAHGDPGAHRLLTAALFLSLALTSLILPRTAAAEPSIRQFPEEELRAYLDKAARAMGLPMLSLAVSHEGETVFTYARGRDVTPDTVSYIGSVSKSFTALAIMQLVEGGAVDLDAPVSRYLTDFTVSDAITVRHLLNQTSGMTDKEYIPVLPVDASVADLIADMNRIVPRHPAGTSYAYFNQNYSLLGAIIERVSGTTYESYLEEHVLLPLGLTNTYLRGEVDVVGHLTAFTLSLPRREPFPRYDMPGGYISSTANELIAYLDMLAKRDERLGVSAAGIDLMMQADPYGMGWMAGPIAGRPAVHHGGSLPGYVANTVMLTEDGYSIAFLTNKNYMLYGIFLYPDLTEGIVSIITGQQPAQRLYLTWIMRAMALVVLFNLYRAFGRSSRLLRQARPLPRGRRLFKVAINLLIPPAVVLAIPVIVSALLGRGMIWSLAFYMMPDMIVWLALGLLSHLVEAVSHIRLLLTADRSLV